MINNCLFCGCEFGYLIQSGICFDCKTLIYKDLKKIEVVSGIPNNFLVKSKFIKDENLDKILLFTELLARDDFLYNSVNKYEPVYYYFRVLFQNYVSFAEPSYKDNKFENISISGYKKISNKEFEQITRDGYYCDEY